MTAPAFLPRGFILNKMISFREPCLSDTSCRLQHQPGPSAQTSTPRVATAPWGVASRFKIRDMKSNTCLQAQVAHAGKSVLATYPGDARVHELYDQDDKFADALRDVVGPDFEYPDHSHKTVAQVLSSH